MNWWQQLLLHTAGLFILLATSCYAALVPPSSSQHTTKSSVTTIPSFTTQRISPPRRSSPLFAVSSTADPAITEDTHGDANASFNNLQAAITLHLNEASSAHTQHDITSQRNAVDNASQTLMQWVELSKGVKSSAAADDVNAADDDIGSSTNNDPVVMPGADVFQSVIQGYLSLPSSVQITQQQQFAGVVADK